MRVAASMNFKGGVAKTTTAINMGMTMNILHGKRVLLVDNDIQANVSKFFDLHDYDSKSMEHIFREDTVDIRELIRTTANKGFDIITANLNLDNAVSSLAMAAGDQLTRLRRALEQVNDDYDYCIIDCSPSIAYNVLNAIVASNDIIIPIKLDKHALDGMQELQETINELIEYNPSLENVICLPTMVMNDEYMKAGEKRLRESGYKVFDTNIRYSPKMTAGTYQEGMSIVEYSPRCSAAVDYKKLVQEYLNLVEAK